MDWWCKNY